MAANSEEFEGMDAFTVKKILLTATVQSHICQFHRPLVQMLRENGDYEIHVAARNNLEEKNGLKLDFADVVYDIPFRRSPFDIRNVVAYWKLKKMVDAGSYDYIHCNTPVGGIVTRLAAHKARKNGAKVFYTAHGFHFYEGASKINWMLYYPLERIFAGWTDKLITINAEDYSLAKKKFSCSAARIHGTGVDPERYTPANDPESKDIKQDLGFSGDTELIVCVGELLPNKNQKLAIEAMVHVIQAHPNAVLLLAGNGPERENLEALVRERNLTENVKFLGYCLTLQDYQKAATLAVSCSRREGLGLNLIEAMLTCNPVVATRNRGHSELVRDGENGFLVSPDDAQELSDRICELLSDSEKRHRMGLCGYEIAQQYTYAEVKRELRTIYFENQ